MSQPPFGPILTSKFSATFPTLAAPTQTTVKPQLPPSQGAQSDAKKCFETFDYSNLNPNPTHRLRADRFLVPILIWGPNNQIRGFAETVFLAIKLNRTLLIPPFFRHTNDVNNEHASLLNPELVIDIQELSKFVSIAPYSRAHETCHGKIGSILLSRNCNTGPQFERLKEFEAYSKLKFLRKGSATSVS